MCARRNANNPVNLPGPGPIAPEEEISSTEDPLSSTCELLKFVIWDAVVGTKSWFPQWWCIDPASLPLSSFTFLPEFKDVSPSYQQEYYQTVDIRLAITT